MNFISDFIDHIITFYICAHSFEVPIQWRWITIVDFENDDPAIDPMAMDHNR
jgi:hypothetical protein